MFRGMGKSRRRAKMIDWLENSPLASILMVVVIGVVVQMLFGDGMETVTRFSENP